jgi:hypothetical protein
MRLDAAEEVNADPESRASLPGLGWPVLGVPNCQGSITNS